MTPAKLFLRLFAATLVVWGLMHWVGPAPPLSIMCPQVNYPEPPSDLATDDALVFYADRGYVDALYRGTVCFEAGDLFRHIPPDLDVRP